MRLGNDLMLITKKLFTIYYNLGMAKTILIVWNQKWIYLQVLAVQKVELQAQFDKIKSQSGTLCNIYNLKLNENGLTELDIETDTEDILMRKSEVENFDT